jgi:pimeloyl-ACP methyl ester carboxylesterase
MTHQYFIHGFLEDSSMWKSLVPKSASHHLLELPGHGNRTEEPCPSSMSAIAEDLIRQLDVSKPFNLIGHSMGGYLIGEMVNMGIQPKQIGLFHSKLSNDDAEKQEQRQRAIDLVAKDKTLYIRTMITNLFPAHNKEEFREIISALVTQANSIHTSTIQACQRAMKERKGGLDSVRKLGIPVHYFSGANDTSISEEQLLLEMATLPSFTHQSFPDLGHMGQWENPDASRQWIDTHFA